jgi:hypothetical protein
VIAYYPASKLKRGRRYCSAECFHLSARKGPEPEPRECHNCKKTFTPRFPAFGDTRFCSRRCWGEYRWKKDGAPSVTNLVDSMLERGLMGSRARSVHLGRRGGPLGAVDGIEAGRAKGGRTRKWATTDVEQGSLQRRILELDSAGRSTREIAETVFGDRNLHLRVWRLLNS